MIERINLLLRAKNITARQFAEEIGIQPSGMSHILSGRNNPSLDFVMKVITRWPEISTDWLLLGKGEMYSTAVARADQAIVKERVAEMPEVVEKVEYDLFSQPDIPLKPQPERVQNVVVQSEVLPPQPQQPQPLEEPTYVYSHKAEDVRLMGEQPSESVGVGEEKSLGNADTQPLQEVEKPVVSEPQVRREQPLATPTAQPNENDVNGGQPERKVVQQNLKPKRAERLVVLYSDHTFAEYRPE